MATGMGIQLLYMFDSTEDKQEKKSFAEQGSVHTQLVYISDLLLLLFLNLSAEM